MTIVSPEATEAPRRGAGHAPPPPDDLPLLDFGPRWRFSWRALLGCLAVVVAAAATTVTLVEGQLNQLAGALSHGPSIRLGNGQLAPAGFGDAQTLLLVGNDWRPHTTTGEVFPHANEMLLVRFDPGKPWISMMSIPRELMVTIPCPNGTVTTRFNYALQCGGVTTVLKTVKQVTGLAVNHVAMINFNSFVSAVNEIGCVYSTIDRRYYHINVPGGAQYFEVNLQPGYQQLCGSQALQFVSYRHGDTSIVRDARDQSFLLAVKQQYGPTLIDNIGKFERIFGQTVTADAGLRSSTGLLNLIGTLISSAGHPVRQVHFPVDLSPSDPLAVACNCVTATPQMIRAAIRSFLFGGGGLPPRRSTTALAHALGKHGRRPAGPSLAPTSSDLAMARAAATHTPFPLEFPTVQDQVAPAGPPDIRNYLIHAPGGVAYPIYDEVFATGQLGQYYDVQGTTWLTAPAFDSPSQTVRIAGRTYYLWYTGAHLVQVAWYVYHVVYWIHNTLSDSVTNSDMLAIAEQTRPVPGTGALARRAVRLRAAPTPKFVPVTQATTLKNSIGALGGLVTAVLLPLGLLAVLLHRRRLTRLRREVLVTVSRMAWLETQLSFVARRKPVMAAPAKPVAMAAPAKPVARAAPAEPVAMAARGFGSRGAVGAPAGVPAPDGWAAVQIGRVMRPAWQRVTIALGLPVLAAVIYLLLSSQAGAHRRALRRAPAPSVPVVVLNASSVPGAAHQFATRLDRLGARVSGVGNLRARARLGYEVLYAPDERQQALLLSGLVAAQHPTVAPIDPATAAAAGPGAKVVLVMP